MPYLYETHLHTSVSSACGKSRGAEYVEGYKALGYDGIFVTDHFFNSNTCVPRELEWRLWAERYCLAWRETAEAGRLQGLKVFFGWESTYGTGEDFLIYGLSPDWLSDHPEIISLSQQEQYACVKEAGGLVVQAHPFRERLYMREIQLHPNHCDAWEVANAGNEPWMDKNAYEYAAEHGLKMTCGSDIHHISQLEKGNVFPMITDEPLNSESDYVNLIKSGAGWKTGFPSDRTGCKSRGPFLPVWPVSPA